MVEISLCTYVVIAQVFLFKRVANVQLVCIYILLSLVYLHHIHVLLTLQVLPHNCHYFEMLDSLYFKFLKPSYSYHQLYARILLAYKRLYGNIHIYQLLTCIWTLSKEKRYQCKCLSSKETLYWKSPRETFHFICRVCQRLRYRK